MKLLESHHKFSLLADHEKMYMFSMCWGGPKAIICYPILIELLPFEVENYEMKGAKYLNQIADQIQKQTVVTPIVGSHDFDFFHDRNVKDLEIRSLALSIAFKKPHK
jgi:hypothetical protein